MTITVARPFTRWQLCNAANSPVGNLPHSICAGLTSGGAGKILDVLGLAVLATVAKELHKGVTEFTKELV